VVRALAVDEVLGRLELLAADTIQPFIETLVDVAGLVEPGQKGSNPGFVVRIARSDELIVGEVELAPGVFEANDDVVDELLWRLPAIRRGLGDLGTVLVGAGQEHDLVAPRTVIPRQHVGGNRRVRMADVRDVIYIINWGRDVELGH